MANKVTPKLSERRQQLKDVERSETELEVYAYNGPKWWSQLVPFSALAIRRCHNGKKNHRLNN